MRALAPVNSRNITLALDARALDATQVHAPHPTPADNFGLRCGAAAMQKNPTADYEMEALGAGRVRRPTMRSAAAGDKYKYQSRELFDIGARTCVRRRRRVMMDAYFGATTTTTATMSTLMMMLMCGSLFGRCGIEQHCSA